MIATFAIDIGFQGIFGIYSDMLTNLYLIADSKYFLLGNTDISLLGMKGLIFICPISLAGITMALWLVLTRTKFGIAMRAAVENPNLAGTLGINVERVYVVSWFISGGLACLAGTYVVLWLPGSPHVGSDLLISMFAASVLGGLFSVFGAVIGGLMVGGGEVLLTVYASRLLGSWVSVWQSGVPMLIFAVTLLIVPQGVTSVKWDHVILWLRRRK
jgi:branched-chain amino acid transport system permease protein